MSFCLILLNEWIARLEFITPHLSLKRCISNIFLISGAIGPRSGPGAGKKAGYGSGKQTLRLKANGTAAIEEVDNSRSLAEENINKLLENFMGINDSELGREKHKRSDCILHVQYDYVFQPLKFGTWRRGRPTQWSWPRPSTTRTSRRSASRTTSSSSSGAQSQTRSPGGGRRSITTTSKKWHSGGYWQTILFRCVNWRDINRAN